MANETITVQTSIQAPIDLVWDCWTSPDHITQWNFASEEWSCPSAVNDLKPGGRFSWRMEAKDGSMGFDYAGTYDVIDPPKMISKSLDDGRKVTITFSEQDGVTTVQETFEPDEHDPEMQKLGWQAILDFFKRHVESQ